MLLSRLRSHASLTVGFACLCALTVQGGKALEWLEIHEQRGWHIIAERVPREMLSYLIAALVMVSALRLCTDQASHLIRRPGRFLFLLSGVAVLGVCSGWCAHVLMSGGRVSLAADVPTFYGMWLQAMLWGGLVGWVYLLSLHRVQSHTQLATMLVRRVQLARQLAHAQLVTARAQFDPAMVARVLSEVHTRYLTDPADAAALLDELIRYLRLAMNRTGGAPPDAAAEQALCAALAALERAGQTRETVNVAE